MGSWDPKQYAEFMKQRTQPSIDLVSVVKVVNPKNIIDIGCGPGNSTAVLMNKFPEAEITGADVSDSMLETAAKKYPQGNFIHFDISQEHPEAQSKFDIVFSNACLQWVPDHIKLIPRLFSFLRPHGQLLVQIPYKQLDPMYDIIKDMRLSNRWCTLFENDPLHFFTLSENDYFDILAENTEDFTMWKTVYFHRLKSVDDIVDWYKGSGIRPYLDLLSREDASEFLADFRTRLAEVFKERKNGEILFRYPRLFFSATV